MSAPLRLAVFAAGLALVFGLATAVGNALGPVHEGSASEAMNHGTPPHGDPAGGAMDHGGTAAAAMGGDHATPAVGGLAVADGDLRLVVDEPVRPAGQESDLDFRILGPDQRPVTKFDPEQGGVALHLIVVGRDLAGFQHLHPEMAPDGTWSTPLTLGAPGVYRMFTDATVDGRPHTLGTDLFVTGSFVPEPLPAPSTEAVVGGYRVTLDSPSPVAGEEGDLRFTVSRGGTAVTDLEPYLGARGHLVGLRQGDLAYLHLHPSDGPTGDVAAAGGITFAGTFPSAGTYRLFLQFADEGAVHTAALTVEVPR